MKGTAADILVKYLEQEGVEYLFGIPGSHLLPLYDAVRRSGVIKPILAKHEAGAAYMACGYALASGKVGVCCGTVGPGAMNLITGVASAYTDSIPLIVLTAQVGSTTFGKGALQEGTGVGRTVHHVGLFERITKLSTLEIHGEGIPFAIKRALRVALSGRKGPVHIDLPADVQAAKIEADIEPVTSYRTGKEYPVDPASLGEITDLLLRAKKPGILLGFGGRSLNEALVDLAEKLECPVATSLRAKGGFPEDHRLSLGCVGLYGTRAANAYMRSGLDVLLTLGTSFHEFTTHCWDEAFVASEALIQVDIDPDEVGKNFPVTLPLAGDCGSIVQALLKRIGERRRSGEDIERFKNKTDYFSEPQMKSDATPIKPQRLMGDVSKTVSRSATISADIGNTLVWAERNFMCYPEGRFITLTGLAAMGSATAAIIGGKLGRPDQPALCFCGDGDFFMTGMEIATAVHHRIPVVWVVLKNSRLGMIHDNQSLSYQNRYIASDFVATDFVALAEALGAKGRSVEKPEEIGRAISEALETPGPAVIEVTIDPDELPPIKPRMMALQRSVGNPDVLSSMSWDAVKALFTMIKER